MDTKWSGGFTYLTARGFLASIDMVLCWLRWLQVCVIRRLVLHAMFGLLHACVRKVLCQFVNCVRGSFRDKMLVHGVGDEVIVALAIVGLTVVAYVTRQITGSRNRQQQAHQQGSAILACDGVHSFHSSVCIVHDVYVGGVFGVCTCLLYILFVGSCMRLLLLLHWKFFVEQGQAQRQFNLVLLLRLQLLPLPILLLNQILTAVLTANMGQQQQQHQVVENEVVLLMSMVGQCLSRLLYNEVRSNQCSVQCESTCNVGTGSRLTHPLGVFLPAVAGGGEARVQGQVKATHSLHHVCQQVRRIVAANNSVSYSRPHTAAALL